MSTTYQPCQGLCFLLIDKLLSALTARCGVSLKPANLCCAIILGFFHCRWDYVLVILPQHSPQLLVYEDRESLQTNGSSGIEGRPGT